MDSASLVVEYLPWATAIVGIALLILIPTKVYAFAVFAVVIAIGVVVYYYVDKARDERDSAAVSISVTHDAKTCGESVPLLVVVNNGSPRAVTKVAWNIAAYVPEDNRNLAWYGRTAAEWDTQYSSDRVLVPGDSASYCYGVPILKTSIYSHNLTYGAIHKSVEFGR